MEDEVLVAAKTLIDVKPRYDGSKSETSDNSGPSSNSEWLPFHPTESRLSYLVLVLICFADIGFTICGILPAALMDHFHKDLDLSTTKFAMLFSSYFFPNIVACFIGGFLIDKFLGIRLGIILCVLLSLIGQILFATAVFFNDFPTMIIARFLYGLGCESLTVALNCFSVLWFQNQGLNTVFGLHLSLSNLGMFLSFWVSEPLYSFVHQSYGGPKGLGIVIFIASSSCVFSFLCSLILGYIDKRTVSRNHNVETTLVKFADIGKMPLIFWMVCISGMSYVASIATFITLANLTTLQAAKTGSLMFIICVLTSPIFGIVIDRTGRKIYYILLAIVATFGAHLIFVFSNLHPYFGMTIIGLSFSMLMSGFLPLIALIIPDHQMATAYGISQASQNLGSTVISLLAGVIVDSGGYFWVEIFFMGILTISFLTTLFVLFIDNTRERILNMSNGEKVIRQQIVNESKSIDTDGEGECLIRNSDLQISNQILPQIDLSGNLSAESLDKTKIYGSTSTA